MTIQLTIHIVKRVYNRLYTKSNNYTTQRRRRRSAHESTVAAARPPPQPRTFLHIFFPAAAANIFINNSAAAAAAAANILSYALRCRQRRCHTFMYTSPPTNVSPCAFRCRR